MADLLYSCPDLTVNQSPLPGLIQIGIWGDSPSELSAPDLTALDRPWPENGQRVSRCPGGWVYRTAPDTLLVRLDSPSSPLAGHLLALPSAQYAVSDLSHSRQLVTMTGKGGPLLLRRALSPDLSLSALPPETFLQSHLLDANILLHNRGEERLDLLVPTSFTEATAQWICRIAPVIFDRMN
ncbi:hypothetical protein ACTL6U_18365 [Rhodovibrionaceae bacterium A322]